MKVYSTHKFKNVFGGKMLFRGLKQSPTEAASSSLDDIKLHLQHNSPAKTPILMRHVPIIDSPKQVSEV